MAGSTIAGGCRVWGRRCFTDRVDTIVPIVAIGARLRYRVDDPVFEKPAEAEGLYVMADTTIHGRHGMAVRLTRRRNTVTGIAGYSRADNLRAGMVGVGIAKISRVMAQFAFPG